MNDLVEAGERAPQRLRRKALDAIDSLGTQPEVSDPKSIHDARRRLKELRALAVLLGRGKDASLFRDAGRTLSRARDAKAAIEAFDRLRDRFSSEWTPRQFDKIRRALAARAQAIGAIGPLRSVDRGRVAAWPVDEMHRDDLLRGLTKSYRRARRAMKRAIEHRTPATIHEWRKRVKMHWYHAQFLTMVSLGHFEARNESLRRLSRALGDHHDLILIDDICRHTPELFGSTRYARLFHTFVARALTELFGTAEEAGRELFREPTREWIAGVRDEEPRLRIGPKKTPPRQTSRPRMLA